MSTAAPPSPEHADLIDSLDRHRFFLRNTLRELTDEQARQRTTASELTLGGLIRHVARAEAQWANFIVEGPSAMGAFGDEDRMQDWTNAFVMTEADTIQSVLDGYASVASRTNELVLGCADLNAAQPLPEAPWFVPGATWSTRRVVLHIIAETAQHAGHADIIREALDGSKSMG